MRSCPRGRQGRLVCRSLSVLHSCLTRLSGLRWRLLEATLAAVGSQSEFVADLISDAEDLERPSPVDIENLVSNVIPPVLGLQGTYALSASGSRANHSDVHRVSLPSGSRFRVREPVLGAPQASDCFAVSERCFASPGSNQRKYSSQSISRAINPDVSSA